MRIDRSDSADGPGDANIERSARPTPDGPDVTEKAEGKEVNAGSSPDSSPALSDSAFRIEQRTAYYAKINAVYRQHDDRLAEADGAAVLVHGRDLPAGYTPSPGLKGDPYHPDQVAARSVANRELYAATSRDRAAALGYTTRIPAQKAPFDSHGQEVFSNGKSYITPDVDEHNAANGWKMFSRRGARIGTYDSELNYVKE